MPPFPLLSLPGEVLAAIACLLGREGKKRLRGTCRALRSAANGTVTRVAIADDLALPPAATFPFAARIDLAPAAPSHAQLQALITALPQWPLLEAFSTPGHCSDCIQALAAACPRLRQLELWALGACRRCCTPLHVAFATPRDGAMRALPLSVRPLLPLQTRARATRCSPWAPSPAASPACACCTCPTTTSTSANSAACSS